ncbi:MULTISPECIES: hypothetical protein [unclassified Streptomyces]|uniref:hypothetical protein n=1 Tax=unclassified Streptomyces TaxID=2593676 RepID=UPI002E2132C6|nr:MULTISPECIES: hypothetical protein [unclassified Streptomyces]WSV01920.1 hypothetical protein OG217_37430 [Streptomyces sp. NBC_01023]WSX47374.1 hypothetical protein OG760_37325 [Streptomyces sp. NBC_00963]
MTTTVDFSSTASGIRNRRSRKRKLTASRMFVSNHRASHQTATVRAGVPWTLHPAFSV